VVSVFVFSGEQFANSIDILPAVNSGFWNHFSNASASRIPRLNPNKPVETVLRNAGVREIFTRFA
jgi:hypothetical protein